MLEDDNPIMRGMARANGTLPEEEKGWRLTPRAGSSGFNLSTTSATTQEQIAERFEADKELLRDVVDEVEEGELKLELEQELGEPTAWVPEVDGLSNEEFYKVYEGCNKEEIGIEVAKSEVGPSVFEQPKEEIKVSEIIDNIVVQTSGSGKRGWPKGQKRGPRKGTQEMTTAHLTIPEGFTQIEPEVGLLVPAHTLPDDLTDAVEAALQAFYDEHEVTLPVEILIRKALRFYLFPEAGA